MKPNPHDRPKPFGLARKRVLDEDDDDELVQVSHLVPKSVKEQAHANSEYGELSEAVRDAYRVIAYGDAYAGPARLRQELEKLRNDRERTESELDDLRDRLDVLDQREAELERRIDEAEARETSFDDAIDSLEADLRDGMAVFPDHGRVQSLVAGSEYTADDIIAELRERNPSLPEAAFKPQDSVAPTARWAGIDGEDGGST